MKLLKGFSFSLLIHALLFSAGFGYIAWEKAHAVSVMDIDLHNSSLLLRPKQISGGRRLMTIPLEPWYLTTNKRTVPAVPKVPQPRPTEEPILSAPVADNPNLNGPPGPGTAPEWVPASLAAHSPDWVEGFITEDDYPPVARKQGKEGRVVAVALIDAQGIVRDVQITEGSYPEFNQLVLERLKAAKFLPARDQNNQPIGVRMTIPIVFELH
jgi:TonB family protein